MTAVIRTLSADTIEQLRAKVAKQGVAKTFRGCRVTESTFRRGLDGRSLSERSHRLMTAYARDASMKGGNAFYPDEPKTA